MAGLAFATLCTAMACAREPEIEPDASTSPLVDDVAGRAEAGATVESGRRLSPRGPTTDRQRWIHRYPPTNHMLELGVYGGAWFPSRHLELFQPDRDAPNNGFQRFDVAAPDVGLRIAYLPFWFFGLELEGGVMPTETRSTDRRATAWTFRGHLIAQLGLWSVTPFLLAGVGALGVQAPRAPESVGNDEDVAIHFGGGIKVFVNRNILLRLDIRNVASNRRGVGEGVTSSPEILLGLSFTLGRERERERKPQPALGDRDGDRVADVEDYCPDVFGVPPRGCPQVCLDDNDADGLANPEDRCPEQPETRNGFEDGDGCPDEVPPELDQLAGVMEGITFDTDQDTIKAESQPRIDNAVEVMKKYDDLRVEVIGHTDASGGYRHNVELSRRRAESVKRAMVEHGIDPTRIETRGAGPDEPIDTNDTPAGRARNRRIEFRILEASGGAEISTNPSDGG